MGEAGCSIIKKIGYWFFSLLKYLGLQERGYRFLLALRFFRWDVICHNFRYINTRYANGLRIPPFNILLYVLDKPDIKFFLESGKITATAIQAALHKNNLSMDGFQEVFEFGCGCGRIIRHWVPFKKVNFWGSDYNPKLIKWCKENLLFASFIENKLYPPLALPDYKFDFIYASSVFTHLTEELQLLWMKELARVLKPKGHLLISVHGEYFFKTLIGKERDDYRSGKLILRFKESVGSNICGAYHPEAYVRERLAAGFKILDFIPCGEKGNGFQDYYLLIKEQ